MTFRGRRAVVTGAAQGVGRAVAELLAERGAAVEAVDVDPRVESLESKTVRARIVDLSDPDAVRALASALVEDAPVDVLVNNAAAYPPGGLLASEDADWVTVLQVNVLAAATLSRAVAASLIASGRPGAIVNVGSVQEALPLPGYAAYVTSKAALTGLTNALAVELGEYAIRVNEVTLSLVGSATLDTKLGSDFWATTAPPTLLRRAGTVREAAEAIGFLCSDAASYLTGAVLAVDGGRRLSRRTDPQVTL